MLTVLIITLNEKWKSTIYFYLIVMNVEKITKRKRNKSRLVHRQTQRKHDQNWRWENENSMFSVSSVNKKTKLVLPIFLSEEVTFSERNVSRSDEWRRFYLLVDSKIQRLTTIERSWERIDRLFFVRTCNRSHLFEAEKNFLAERMLIDRFIVYWKIECQIISSRLIFFDLFVLFLKLRIGEIVGAHRRNKFIVSFWKSKIEINSRKIRVETWFYSKLHRLAASCLTLTNVWLAAAAALIFSDHRRSSWTAFEDLLFDSLLKISKKNVSFEKSEIEEKRTWKRRHFFSRNGIYFTGRFRNLHLTSRDGTRPCQRNIRT